MLKKELGVLLAAVEKMGIDPLETFRWDRSEAGLEITVNVEPQLHFQVASTSESFNSFQVGWSRFNKQFSYYAPPTALSKSGVCEKFEKWYNTNVKPLLEEYHAPDPLEELQKRARMKFHFGPDSPHTEQYTATEKEFIRSKLTEFKTEILNAIPLNQDGKKYIEKGIHIRRN